MTADGSKFRPERRFVTADDRKYMLKCAALRDRLTNKAIARKLGFAENTVAKEIWKGRRRG